MSDLCIVEKDRREKLGAFWSYNFVPNYRTVDLQDFDSLNEGDQISLSGRVCSFRDLNHIIFIHLSDVFAKVQILINDANITNVVRKYIDVGDLISVEGTIGFSQTGHKSLIASVVVGRRKALLALPEKWVGLKNEEEIRRKRYLDLITNENTRNRFHTRLKIVKLVREFFYLLDFQEVETPILQNIASGAAAKPFKTHHNALDIDMYLRIAPELFLKRLIIAGYPRVFEVGKCFRNEGIDSSHLQEFTMLEMYDTYLSYKELKNRAKNLVLWVLNSTNYLNSGGNKILEIPEYSYKEFLLKYGNLDIDQFTDWESLSTFAKKHNVNVNDYPTYYTLLERLYKILCVSKIEDPILVYDYPCKPLAKKSDTDERFGDIIQVIMRQKEIINAYLEQNDPDIQVSEFIKQQKEAQDGNEETVATDMDFVEALKHGLPPTAGLGMGIDRLVQIITKTDSIKDVVFFPNVKELS